MITVQELFECVACFPVGEINEENCDQKILDVPSKCDHGVPSGIIVGKLKVYFELNTRNNCRNTKDVLPDN
jgi:hypothetical protein